MLTLTDQNDDGDLDAFDGDSIDGVDITASYPGDTITLRIPGEGRVVYTGTTFYLADGRTFFTPTDGQILLDGTFRRATAVNDEGPLDVNDLGPPCFVSGTLIDTPDGPKPVETLEVGDKVVTADRGPQEIRWVGSRTVAGQGAFAPIRIAQGVLGNRRTLMLSPQHRVLVDGWRAEMLFGVKEVLAAAKHLINGRTICQVPQRRVTYLHILFDQHELIWSEGCLSESFFPGDTILSEDAALHAEITALFPQLEAHIAGPSSVTARTVLRGYEARTLQVA